MLPFDAQTVTLLARPYIGQNFSLIQDYVNLTQPRDYVSCNNKIQQLKKYILFIGKIAGCFFTKYISLLPNQPPTRNAAFHQKMVFSNLLFGLADPLSCNKSALNFSFGTPFSKCLSVIYIVAKDAPLL